MAFEIASDRLKGAAFVRANSSGASMPNPTAIVVHDTAGREIPKSSVDWFASRKCTTSAHFVVEVDGSVTQMVECDQKAFHAGKSTYKGRAGCNNFTIGIEIVNPGKLDKNGRAWFHKKNEKGYSGIQNVKTKAHGDGYWLPYTEAQIKTVTDLCKALVKAYPSIVAITTHWEISPGRKVDPNPLFPLEELRAAVFKPAKRKPAAQPEPEEAPSPPPVAAVADEAPVASTLVATSRKAKVLSRVDKVLKGVVASLTLPSILEYMGFAKSTIDQVGQFVQTHALVLVITAAILGLLIVKYIYGLMQEDVEEGRYVPSGEKSA
jgi:N-acetylmuramoyl-L-alanine amidase